MKRHGNLFEAIVNKDTLYQAYRNARKGKSWQNTIGVFERDLDENLNKIRQSLINKTFTTSPYKIFSVHEPKERLIYRLPFNPDRVVQHALMDVVEPIWDNLFIYDSYACRKGKGIHIGSRRTMEFMRATKGYCLKMDVSKFYASINHDILFEIVQRKIKCPDTLWLLKDIIYSIEGPTNIPIGNYTSQWLGNLYLNELDQMLKSKYKIKHYIRYCDDFLLLHKDKDFLGEMRDIITDFLRNKLTLNISRQSLFPVKDGIDFLGYRHFPDYILLRKSTAKRVKKRLRLLPWLLKAGKITADSLRSSIASTEGWLKWCNAYNFKRSLHLEELRKLYV
jgi:retron-type reverse transcriptase